MKRSHTIRLERIEEGQERAFGVAVRDGWSWRCRTCNAVGPECAEADEATTSAAVHLAVTQGWAFSAKARAQAVESSSYSVRAQLRHLGGLR